MNATQITVPSKSGAQGDSIENFVLDRVSGDVEKNLGNVLENILEGASVPMAVLIVLDGPSQIRRAYAFPASSLINDTAHATEATRRDAIEASLSVVFGEPAGGVARTFELADPTSSLKSKAWDISGLTQNATVAGTSGLELVDAMFLPSRRTYTVAALVAKLEDLALENQVVGIFLNQNFPEVTVYTAASEGEFDAASINDFSATVAAQVNAVFVSGSSESNPSFGFESGGGF